MYNQFMSRSVLYELSDEVLVKNKKNIKFKARGSSMRPFVKDGDVVEIQPKEAGKIKNGDIVLFNNGSDALCLHRVIKIENGVLLIKGDASRNIDGATDPGKVIGKLISIERNGSKISISDAFFDRTFRKLFSFSWLWHAFSNPLKIAVKFILRPIHNLFLNMPFVRKNLKKYSGKHIKTLLAKQSDAYDISLLYKQPYPKEIKRIAENIKNKDGTYIVSKFKDQIIGIVSLYYENKKEPWCGWWLTGLMVKAKFRGFGAGESIVRLAIKEAVKNKGKSLKLFAFEGRKPAYNLYTRLGFKRVVDLKIEKLLIKETEAGHPRRIYMVRNLQNEILPEKERCAK